MAAYAEQVLISTGRDDWSSRIEEEEDAVLARGLKDLLGRNGKFSNPFHNVMVTHSSFTPSTSGTDTASAYLFPTFRYVPSIPLTQDGIETFTRAFILPSKLHATYDSLSPSQQEALKRNASLQSKFSDVQEITDIVIQICGHGGRDQRCGIMGPLLRSEFEEKLEIKGITIETDPPIPRAQSKVHAARVGLISHIGGHKYAGNVIIYIPPSMKAHPLAGKGIWYGRIGPRHVEGIVQQTILEGKVVKDKFRGGIEQGSNILRM